MIDIVNKRCATPTPIVLYLLNYPLDTSDAVQIIYFRYKIFSQNFKYKQKLQCSFQENLKCMVYLTLSIKLI